MKNRKIKIILILIIFFICIIIFFHKNYLKTKNNDDFLFLKFLSNVQKNPDVNYSGETGIYKFNVKYKDMDLKSIKLEDTIDKETLIYEKIAPGTSGKFQIELTSNKNLRYQINFKNQTSKPKNLYFRINIKDETVAETNSIEELEKNLQGKIYKNEKIIVDFEWCWKFQNLNNLEITDTQDTKDSRDIKQYKFDIQVTGIDAF